MKTSLMVMSLAFMISFAGNATNVPLAVKSPTETAMVSNATARSVTNMEKSKKAHHKKQKKSSSRNKGSK